jgi:hypothetical protein
VAAVSVSLVESLFSATPTRSLTILEYLNRYNLTNVTAEGRVVQWLVDEDVGMESSNEFSLRQRNVLATLWF